MDLLKRLYVNMLKCRMVEEQLPGTCSANTGLEATIVGATIDLRPEDAIAPSRSGLFAHVMNGTSLQYVFAQSVRHGKKQAAEPECAEKGVASTVAVAASLNVAVGMALSFRLQKRANVVVALSDDTSASVEAWQEALAFAGHHRLPVLFVIEYNLGEQAASGQAAALEALKSKAQSYGFPVITVDGNDAVAVYRVCYEARECARQGYGPTLVESCTRRCAGHLEGKSSQLSSSETCQSSDPIPAMESYLRRQSLWDDRWKRELVKGVKDEIREALKSAKKPDSWLPEEALKVAYSLPIPAGVPGRGTGGLRR
jgi:TPP-dependent pyruvate/acetoin dehydrogenase alpha subunit